MELKLKNLKKKNAFLLLSGLAVIGTIIYKTVKELKERKELKRRRGY